MLDYLLYFIYNVIGDIMLCQNCKRNDASAHLKRIMGGEAVEIHLCRQCASALGVGDVVAGFFPFGDFPSFSADVIKISEKTLRCETCGFSFEDIARTGMPGCPECYGVFSKKLRPLIGKIHGRAVFEGKAPLTHREEMRKEQVISALREKLDEAIMQENFELAAVIRDEIKALSLMED